MAEFRQHVLPEVNVLTEDLQRFQGILSTNNSIAVQVSKRQTSRFSTTYVLRLDTALTISDINVTVLFYSPRLNILNGYKTRFQVYGEVPDDVPFPVGRMLKPVVWDAASNLGNAKHFGVEIQPFSLDNEEIETFRLYFGTFICDTSTNIWRTHDVTNWQMFQEIHSAWVREEIKWSQENAPGREEKISE